jgi:FkbH-like protein
LRSRDSPGIVPESFLHWLPRLEGADRALRAAQRIPDPAARIAEIVRLARHQLDFAQIRRLDQALTRAGIDLLRPPDLLPIKLAWAGEGAIFHLLPATRVAGLRRGLLISSTVLDPGSSISALAPHAVLFGVSPDEIVPSVPLSADAAFVERAVEARVASLRRRWEQVREQLKCLVIQEIAPDLSPSIFGSFDRLVPGAPASVVTRLNQAIARAAAEDRVLVLDLEAASAKLGKEAWFDPVRGHPRRQLVSPLMAPLYGDTLARVLAAARGLSKKCLVLDLDNTLWGGVVGDDGVDNIVIGRGNAAGEAFVAFQRYARALKDRGVILAVCSKNDLATAEVVFQRRPEMVLKRDDIAAFICSWDDKAKGLAQIASALNLGLDALVFFDDDPAERALIRQRLPSVAVPEVPKDPALYARCLADAGYFEATAFTAEDRARAAQYLANARRDEERAAAGGDLDRYLGSLQMEMTVGRFEDAALPRVIQLIHKTNQVNLTARRYTEAAVREVRADPRSICLHFRLKDAFGDNGIISLVIARRPGDGEVTFEIDTWLMSCRVIGRGVEAAVLHALAEIARRMGGAELVGDYLPTAKNAVAREHYAKLGFQRIAEDHHGPGSTRWRLSLADHRPLVAHIIIR